MKNDCTYNCCSYQEKDGTCERDINSCEDYIPSISHEKMLSYSESFIKGLIGSLVNTERQRKLDEDLTKLEKLSGYSLEELIERFASGWTLEPPLEKAYMLSDLFRRNV